MRKTMRRKNSCKRRKEKTRNSNEQEEE